MIHLALYVWAFLFLAGIACYALYAAGWIIARAWKPLAVTAAIAALVWLIWFSQTPLPPSTQVIHWQDLPH